MSRRSLPYLAIALALGLFTFVSFLPVLRNGFILFDDPAYITRNPHVTDGLSWAGMLWAITGTASDNWHPLTWISHMLDVSLFGLNPAAHHLSSLLLHAVNAVLLFLVLAAMTGRRWTSALVAALCAVHPLHVESVAWASERKDLLAGFFWVLTLGAYLHYVRRPGAGRYALTALCFVLGLLSKQMLVTLPFVLLLLDWWPLGRTARDLNRGPRPAARKSLGSRLSRTAELIVEKAPLLALAVAAGLATFFVQRETGAVKGLDAIPLVPRVFNALVSYAGYLEKTVWPFNLSPLYPHPGPHLALGAVVVSLGILLTVSLAVRLLGRQRPWLAVGWLWFLVTLLPVIGIVQIGWQAMADRYTYLPLIGVFLACSWETAEHARRGAARLIFPAGALLLLVGLAALTWRQTTIWRDSVGVFEQAVATTSDNLLAEYYLGKAQRLAGNPEAAIHHLRKAIRINPRYPGISAELGVILSERGDIVGAIRAYGRALLLEPDSAPTHNNLGYALARLGQHARALSHYEAAIRIDPQYSLAHANAAAALAHLGRQTEAEEHRRFQFLTSP